MRKLYCGDCSNYLMGGDGECHDCACGWKQPLDERESEPFEPDWVSPPGETMADWLEEHDVSLASFGSQMGLCEQDVAALLCGKMVIDTDIAFKLQDTIGSSASFWVERDRQYREALGRLSELDG